MPFPLIKLGSLFVKQLSKPMANALKRSAKEHKIFRNICLKLAETHHHFEVVWKNQLMGYGTKTKPRIPLNEEKAVELGADMISEAFLYTFAVSILCGEYWWSSRTAEKKDNDQKTQTADVDKKINELLLETDTMQAEIREMRRLIYSAEDSNFKLQQKIEELEKNKKKGWW